MHRHITSEPAWVMRAVVLRVWCGAVGRCSCGGAVVVVHGAWCMVHGAVVIVACKN